MALVVKDRVKETTATTGTGTLTLAGAVAGFQTFTSVLSNGDTTYYGIFESSTGEFEVGLGTFTSSGTTLARTTILESSNSGSAINLTAGAADVFITQPAEKAVYLDGSGYIATADGRNLTNVDAATVDSLDSTQFLRSDVADTKTSGDLTFSDSVKAIFGAGSDLQIYHDGSNSYISDQGTGGLRILNDTNVAIKNAAGTADKAIFKTGAEVELYYNGNLKFETTNTGVDVTGTLEVSKSDQTNGATLTITNAFSGGSWAVDDVIGTIDFKTDDASTTQLVRSRIQSITDDVTGTNWSYGTALAFSTAFNNTLSEAMRIDSSGNVGIGVSDPSSYNASGNNLVISDGGNSGITIHSPSTDAGSLFFADGTSGASAYAGFLQYYHSSDILYIGTGGTTRMAFDSSGNVMVGGTVAGNAGTVSLNVGNVGTTNGGLQLWGTTTGTHYVQFGDESGTAANHYRGYMAYAHNGDSLRFGTASTERMRIDSSGNLLVGTTDTTIYNDAADEYGFVVEPSGQMQLSANNATMLYLNRQNGDGEIVSFRKDGSAVGSIGTVSDDLWIGSSTASHAALRFANAAMFPVSNTGGSSDGLVDLGDSLARFKDLYLSGRINMQEDHFINRRFEIDVSGTTIYILLCVNAANNDVNGTITMDRTSGLRFACSWDIIVSSGSSAAPVGSLIGHSVAGSGTPSARLVTLTYSSVSYVALELTNPDQYYESTGAYFNGRILNSGSNTLVDVASGSVSSVSDLTQSTSKAVIGNQLDINGDLNAVDNIYMAYRMYHEGDTDTYLEFGTNAINLACGGGSSLYVVDTYISVYEPMYNYSIYLEDYDALSGTSVTVNCNTAQAFSITLSGNTTFSFNSVTNAWSTGFIMEITGNGSTITWPNSVDWAGGTAPDAPASGETDILVFWTRDGGTTWFGALAIDAAA